jgi:hypothetical protein
MKKTEKKVKDSESKREKKPDQKNKSSKEYSSDRLLKDEPKKL